MGGASCLDEFWKPQLLSVVITTAFEIPLLKEKSPVAGKGTLDSPLLRKVPLSEPFGHIS